MKLHDHNYFMELAKLQANNSLDPVTKVGCVIVYKNKVIGKGFNHFPSTTNENTFPWENDKTKPWLNTKYPYIIHAEMDALASIKRCKKGMIVYVTLLPCNECVKNLINFGVSEIYYLDDKYKNVEAFIAGKNLCEKCGIKYTKI